MALAFPRRFCGSSLRDYGHRTAAEGRGEVSLKGRGFGCGCLPPCRRSAVRKFRPKSASIQSERRSELEAPLHLKVCRLLSSLLGPAGLDLAGQAGTENVSQGQRGLWLTGCELARHGVISGRAIRKNAGDKFRGSFPCHCSRVSPRSPMTPQQPVRFSGDVLGEGCLTSFGLQGWASGLKLACRKTCTGRLKVVRGAFQPNESYSDQCPTSFLPDGRRSLVRHC